MNLCMFGWKQGSLSDDEIDVVCTELNLSC